MKPTEPRAVTSTPTSAAPGPNGLAPSPAPAPTTGARRLHPAVLRLIAVALVFAAWIGYLVYLVATRPVTADGAPLVLSRPQILVSELDVIAEVDATDD